MSEARTLLSADDVIATLRAHEAELRAAGITQLSLFGSVAHGDNGPDSDVDLAAVFDRTQKFGLLELIGLEFKVAEWVGCKVEILLEPVKKQRLLANIDRDRQRVF